MNDRPSTTGANGRTCQEGRGSRGRFSPGNQFAVGNPHAAKVAKLRTAALNATTQKDIRGILKKLTELALAGDVSAAREVLQRNLGPPVPYDFVERLENLENLLRESGR